MIRTWIVDDEPLARIGLKLMLHEASDFEVVGESGDGASALAALNTRTGKAIDVVFMDIQMPDMSGIEVVERLGKALAARLVFVTAYDEYAIVAFDKNAIDYLLKPVDPQRFKLTLARVRELLNAGAAAAQIDATHVLAVMQQLLVEKTGSLDRAAKPSLSAGTPQRIAVQLAGETRLLDIEDIEYFESDGHYAWAHAAAASSLATVSLSALESRLNSARFLRVHRSLLINLNRVTAIKVKAHGEHQFTLTSGKIVTGGRSYAAQIRDALKCGVF